MKFAFAPKRFVLCFAALVLAGSLATNCPATDDPEKAPVYLEEASPPPPPTKVRHLDRKQTYTDKKIRVEYQVIQLSDDTAQYDGKYVEYYHDGQKFMEGTFQDGSYAGQWSYWYPSGQLCKTVTYSAGAPDGEWDVFRADGTHLSHQKYAKGQRDGKWTSYHKDGKTPMLEVSFTNGKANGKRITYNEKGQQRQEMNFVDGQLDGPMIEWDDDGKKTAEAEFKKGQQVGTVKRY